jgi:hypothetical protein
MISVAGPTRSSLIRDRRGAPEQRGGRNPSLEPWSAGVPFRLSCPWAQAGSLRFPGHPSHAFACSKTPAEPAASRPSDSAAAAPGPNTPKALSNYMISGLTLGFSIHCLRFTNSVAAVHARLASGWRAAPLPGGRRTLWVTSKGFRIYIPFSFSGLALTQVGFTLSATSRS